MRNLWGKELTFPEELLYTPELLWVKTESGNKLRIGISDLGVKSVKELLYIRIKSRVGNRVKKGDMIGIVETSKRVWEIIAPVSGVVVAVNEKALQGNTADIGSDPYGEGWLIEMERVNETESELKGLRRGEESKTKKWIEEQVKAIIPLQEES